MCRYFFQSSSFHFSINSSLLIDSNASRYLILIHRVVKILLGNFYKKCISNMYLCELDNSDDIRGLIL
jgi:hypothetical protein